MGFNYLNTILILSSLFSTLGILLIKRKEIRIKLGLAGLILFLIGLTLLFFEI